MNKLLKRFQKEELPKNRIEALSDGIFAIVLTLLVLEIKLPLQIEHLSHSDANLLEGLKQIGPQILSWVSSFLIVAVFWVNHHNTLTLAKRLDYVAVWLNMFFLLAISFTPFPTGILGKYAYSSVAITFFSMSMFVAGLLIIALRAYLVDCVSDDKRNRAHTIKAIIFGPSLYLLAAIFAWLNIEISYLLLLFIPFYFMIPFEHIS